MAKPTKSLKHDDEQWGALFPPRPDKVKEVDELLSKPETTRAYSDFLESQCGATDDSQPVELYDGTLGVTAAFVNNQQSSVGQLQWNDNLAAIYTNPGNVSGVRWCTGTLISNDLFLTAGHCFDQTGGGWTRPKDNVSGATIPSSEIATVMHVNFNYQVDPSGNLRVEQSFPVVDLVEYRLGGLDFAIVRLGGNPGATFGTTGVSTTDAAVNDMACIIGHPAGVPKRLEAGPVTDLHDTRIGYNDIDTLGGNSGSGVVLAANGLIVGVHTNGGCTNPASAGHNHGVRITSIIAQSPTLQTLTAPTLKFSDDGGPKLKFADDGGGSLKFFYDGATLKFVDDGVTLKFTDDGGGTLKFIDDGGGTLKFTDDGGTLKFADDGGGTLKFIDDGATLKFVDDGVTLKFTDDGGGTLKFIDDGGTLKFADDGGGTIKAIDDVKLPTLDKQFGDHKIPGSDARLPIKPGRPITRLGGGVPGGPRPFVLATPHHSMAWARGGRPAEAGGREQQEQYEAAITQLAQMLQQGSEELERLNEQYQSLLAEYQALVSGQQY